LGSYVTPSPDQTELFALSQRKRREYAVFRLVTQPAAASVLTLALCATRRRSLDGWRDDVTSVLVSLLWLLPLALLLVFGPALMASRPKKSQ